MTIQITDLVDAISQLEIAGVRVLDMDEIKPEVLARECPVLMPEPLNFVSNIIITRDTSGAASWAKKTITYTLNYVFLYAPVGTGRELQKYGDMVKKAFAVLDAFISHDDLTVNTTYDEAVDISPVSVTEFGPVPDPSGGLYLGCRMQFVVTEFIN